MGTTILPLTFSCSFHAFGKAPAEAEAPIAEAAAPAVEEVKEEAKEETAAQA